MTTFTKLRNGSWGLRGSNLTEGQVVTVEKKDGQRLTLTVGKVVWRGQDGTTLAEKGASGGSPAPSRYRGRCRGCGGAIVDAPHHRAMGGYCGSCAFDEFDM